MSVGFPPIHPGTARGRSARPRPPLTLRHDR